MTTRHKTDIDDNTQVNQLRPHEAVKWDFTVFTVYLSSRHNKRKQRKTAADNFKGR
jgi:hypothetical protein